MARIKMAYVGGGSTRGAGTMASFIHQGENFEGSEVVLIDLDPERLDLIRRLSERMVKARGLDLTIEATTDRRAGLSDCDAILSSYRPGGFAARVLDERIPLKHGIIGQETQGPGGFFMALRAIHAMQGILSDVEDRCPEARIFNYTNPVNVLAQAVTTHSDVPFVSLCEGPIYFADQIAKACGLERDYLDTVMVGLNHACWSVVHEYKGIDAMDAVFNEKDEVLTVNVPNAGGALPGFDDTLVVELLGRCGGPGGWIEPLPVPAPLPAHVRGLVHELGEYQALAAEAAWSGTRLDGIRALAAHPLMVDLDRTERVYDELAEAHREHLPERLLPA